ncbi:MAG: hypothetical protein E6Q97_22625 [Desulfurellales bacterium]|nr:MAG: hypothetical protein E6Q97_22625 [Desulfurellales bacterium]
MSFEDNPADDRYQLDQCIDEIKSLQSDNAALRAAVKVLREACSREMQFLIRQSCAPHVEGVSLEELYVDHAGNLQAALASTSKFEEPSG